MQLATPQASSSNVVNFNQMIRAIILVVLLGISQLFSDELSTKKNWIFGYPEFSHEIVLPWLKLSRAFLRFWPIFGHAYISS